MAVATILIILAFNILLPTADVFTDIILVIKLYSGGHPAIATVLLMPFLLNYIVCFYTFFRLTTNRKKYTFIFPLLNLYPQYEAAKLIYSIYKDPVKGKKEKKDYDQNIGLHEVFLESVPTALIITVIFVRTLAFEPGERQRLGEIIFGEGTIIEDYDSYFTGGLIEFIITFSLSVFSASLGLAKCLKNGVARPIGDGGCLDGLLSCRHLLAFFACGLCLVARGVCLGIVAWSSTSTPSDLGLFIFILFFPQCLLAIFSILNLSRELKNSLKIITHHPSLLLLPIFTFFTFSKVKVCDVFGVKFSKKFTLGNMAVSAVGYVFWAVWYFYRFDTDSEILYSLTPFLLSTLLTTILLRMDRAWTVRFSCSSTPGEVTSMYCPTTDKRFVMIDGELVEPPEDNVETGDTPSSSFCGCYCPVQEQNTEDIALSVIINEQEVEVDQIVEDVIEELLCDIVK